MSSDSQSNPRVSVVVPSHNHGPFIEQCLRSIISQTRQPDELLVIDDGSSDDSPAIIERVLKECPFPTELIARENRGLCATLNEAFAKSSGEYFAYLGSDDRWLPEFLDARVRLLESRPSAVLGYGHAYFLDENDLIFDCTADWAGDAYLDGDAREMIFSGTGPISSTVFYRRSALEGHRWNENSRLEDYEMYLRLCTQGEFAFDPAILSIWRWHSYNHIHDLTFMLTESLGAQERTAGLVGWSAEELALRQRRLRFKYVDESVRTGDRRQAVALLGQSFLGAPSLTALAKTALRVALPQSIIRRRRNAVWERKRERFRDVQF